tara:strand:+ start:319 stop:552 length:234 start_codon:yes stop_codon:yes gene_type:complete
MNVQEEKEKEKIVQQLIADYKFVFSSEEGMRVLADLKRRLHYFTTTNVKGDSHESAFLEGQRAAILWIDNIIKQKER